MVLLHPVEPEPRAKLEPPVIRATLAQPDLWDIVVHKVYAVTQEQPAILVERAKLAELVELAEPVIQVTRAKPDEQVKLAEPDIEEQLAKLVTPATQGLREQDPPAPPV